MFFLSSTLVIYRPGNVRMVSIFFQSKAVSGARASSVCAFDRRWFQSGKHVFHSVTDVGWLGMIHWIFDPTAEWHSFLFLFGHHPCNLNARKNPFLHKSLVIRVPWEISTFRKSLLQLEFLRILLLPLSCASVLYLTIGSKINLIFWLTFIIFCHYVRTSMCTYVFQFSQNWP